MKGSFLFVIATGKPFLTKSFLRKAVNFCVYNALILLFISGLLLGILIVRIRMVCFVNYSAPTKKMNRIFVTANFFKYNMSERFTF